MQILLTAVIAGALLAPFSLAQKLELKLDHLKAKAKESSEVDLDGAALGMALNAAKGKLEQKLEKKSGEANPEAIKRLVEGIKGIYVRNYEFEKAGQYTDDDVESVLKQIRANPGWSRLVSVKEPNERVEIHMMNKGDHVEGLVIVAAESNELTVVNIVGSVTVDQAKELVNSSIQYDMGALMAATQEAAAAAVK